MNKYPVIVVCCEKGRGNRRKGERKMGINRKRGVVSMIVLAQGDLE